MHVYKDLTPDEIDELQLDIITHLKRELGATKQKLARAEKVVESCIHLRRYCLGSDASTQNMIEKFDEALKAYRGVGSE